MNKKASDIHPTNSSNTITTTSRDVVKRKSLPWTYGEKLHMLNTALTAKAQGQSFVSVARALRVSDQTVYGLVKNRKEIEKVACLLEGGASVTRNRKSDNLRTINVLVLNELSARKSGISTMGLIKSAREAGVRLRMKLLKEQVIARNELARLENFKASIPWAKKLVVRLRNGWIKDTNVQECDQVAFGLTAGSTTSSNTKHHILDE
jgi:hypothetical protein